MVLAHCCLCVYMCTPYFHLSYNIIHSPCTAIMSPALYQCMLAAVNGKTLTVLVVVYFVAKISRTAAQRSQNKPHIVFTLVDNWGFAEAGFRNPAVKTPNFDMLATAGLVLNRHYVFKYCSPSRVSFLTGCWPHQYKIYPEYKVCANSED